MIFHEVETVTHFLPSSQQKMKELAMNGCIQLVLRFWKLKADKVKMYFPQEQFAALLLNDEITIITPCLLIINIIYFVL